MPPRQVWLFKFGCWAAMATAAVHVAAHLAWPFWPDGGTGVQLADLASDYRFAPPGGPERSLADFVAGLSLGVALLLATVGGLGLIVQKRARHDAVLMSSVARMSGVSTLALLGVSLANFFIVPSLFVALIAVCFLVASVESPEMQLGGAGHSPADQPASPPAPPADPFNSGSDAAGTGSGLR